MCGALAVVAYCCHAGIGLGAEDGEPPDTLHADANQTDVYLNDSIEATDAIAAAREQASRGRWSEAAEILQRTSDSAGDKLIRISSGSYVGIREHIAELMAAWPTVGIRAYRSLYERDLARAREARSLSRTTDDLLALFEAYFCTAGAADLADVIGQLAIESGDLALAERIYRRVVERHPDRTSHAKRCRAMLTLIGAMRNSGNVDLPAIQDDVEIRWKGESRALADAIREIHDSFDATGGEPSPLEWPIFGGSTDRNRPGSSRIDDLGLLWRFHVVPPESSHIGESDDDGAILGLGEYDRALSAQPVVSGGLVLIQWQRQIIALHRNTGVVQWRFDADAGLSTDFDEFEERPTGWQSVTAHDGRVYAVLPGDVLPYYAYESVPSATELACLDLETGNVIWRSSQDDLGHRFASLFFDSSPIVARGRLYVVGRRRRSFGFEDCYLYRFSTADGTLEFRTHLGSASTGTFSSQEATMAVAALSGDTMYVCTNLGSIAAVSAHTGAVRWLRLYQRDQHDESRGSSWFSRDVRPWQLNPVIASNGRIIVSPTDCDNLLVLAQADGRVVHTLPKETLGHLETVFGVRGDLLCGAGEEVVCYHLGNETTQWWSPLPGDEVLGGRGVWVDDRLLVPTQAGLSTFRVSDGRSTDVLWDSDGQTGNLLALGDQLIVAGAASVSAYVPKAEIWTALRERMAAAPSDPLPALELAEVAFGSGEPSEALATLDEAIRRGGGSVESIDPALRARIFKDVLMFAEQLSARSALQADVLDRLFAYASRYPSDRQEHVRYRMAFGALFEKDGRPERALRLYQQILRDRSLRELVADPSNAGSRLADRDAWERIAHLIDTHGSAIYAPYETEAARWLEHATTTGDEATLVRIVETFPNSKTAPAALVAHGELLDKLGRSQEAAQRFTTAYHRYLEQVDGPSLMRKIADAYEGAGKLVHAYQWLTKAAREHPSVLIDHGGRQVSFSEYRERLAEVRKKVEPSRPKVTLPLERGLTREFAEGSSLLVPWFANDPGCDWSRYYVHTPEGIRAFAARTGAEIWPWPVPSPISAHLLVATSDAVVFATRYEVFAIDPTTGARRWSHGEYPKQLDDDGADWENGRTLRTHTLGGNHLISARDDGLITRIAVPNGRIVWSKTHRPVPAGRVRLGQERLIYDAVEEGRGVLCVLDAHTGAWVGAVETSESHPIEELFVALDGQVIVATSHSVSSYDVEANRRRWRVKPDDYLCLTSLLVDVDSMYLSDDGRRLKKIGLDDGRTLWTSERLMLRGESGLTVQLQDGSVIVSTTSSLSAVDAVTGLTLWRGTTAERPRFFPRTMTEYYVAAVDVPAEARDADSTVYFYDHRHASGVIPRNGGATKLGRLLDIRAILIADGALLIQTGTTVQSWLSE